MWRVLWVIILVGATADVRAHTWTPKQILSVTVDPGDPLHAIQIKWQPYSFDDWNNINLNRYELHRSTDGAFKPKPQDGTRIYGNSFFYVDNYKALGLTPCTRYYFILVQVSNDGHYVLSDPRDALTDCPDMSSPQPDLAGLDATILDQSILDIAVTDVAAAVDLAPPDLTLPADAALSDLVALDAAAAPDLSAVDALPAPDLADSGGGSQTDLAAPVDATAVDVAAPADAGASDGGGNDDPGCGCRVGAARHRAPAALLVAVLLAAGLCRRHRRR